MNEIYLKLHIASSIIPSLLTIIVLYRSLYGYFEAKSVPKLDIRLPLYVVIFLYIQLILGIVLYIIHINDYSLIENSDQAEELIQRRFWALEHFIMMFFVLAFSHIAYIYARNITSVKLFYKRNFLYFSIIFILIIISLVGNAMRYTAVN